ncbi:peptidase U32 family protein [Helicobacter turcicus]|uniref:U32 family peptidase n=1 Tax=Helicobacter turcicus TaxID=2867412 RepID=A0ABS7JNW9_9HELI|nr:peptidase U32 family protein [Helicobacter turcicus]MBX7491110.1 U32 family peptidase [Helicobacter turcicus]MBX7545974.1 U32 family peptidase [Helicobacter turcicus]
MQFPLPQSLKIPELLSPAGNLKKLKIALEYGADAVYGGVSHFSLRNRSGKEFDFDTFKEGVEYTHKKGKKIYVTINGFPFNSQLTLLKNHIEKMASLKPDAFIVATPGVVKLAKQVSPETPIHLSTQANVLNVLDAQVFYDLGVKRIIAARELSLKDAVAIKKAIPNLELEIFIHGSMCFAFSGRCLISALQSGRVPNRGSCANDCRFDYEYYVRNITNDELVRFSGKEFYARNPDNGVIMRLEEEEGIGTHIFNSKDLNLATHIPTILECGAIDSLKIEGRTKSAYYAGITALAYKAALEDYAKGAFVEQKYTKELDTLKNRGFSDGYIIHRPYEKLNTQNHFTAISEGSYQVNAEVSEDGKSALCRHTIRPNEPKEIVSAQPENIKEGKNEIGEIFSKEGKKYLQFFKIILENGKELESIHSGNENPFLLPFTLPPFSFLRQKL